MKFDINTMEANKMENEDKIRHYLVDLKLELKDKDREWVSLIEAGQQPVTIQDINYYIHQIEIMLELMGGKIK